ncbi:hypothetical protein AB0N05_10395 [Nocardia sp. NPDC051030]|uniref:hypothetical protein n=1 Tax=Nocardia sp. NPDC051030 TaxID=3155162 RepID=UPI003423E9B1
MASPAVPSQSAGISGRALAVLVPLAVVLGIATVFAPGRLAALGSGGVDQGNLRDTLRGGFIEYWGAGRRDFPPRLASAVDYWFRFHVAKAVIAALLLIVLVVLGILLWKAFLRASGVRTGSVLASSGVIVTLLGVLALLTVMANIQGMVTPFSSLMPMLRDGDSDPELTATLDQVRQRLAESTRTDDPPALDVMISDFARYHAVMAVIAATVAVVLIAVSVLLWKHFRSASDRRTRRVLACFGILSALGALALLIVLVGNISVAADATPALKAFFEGGW